MMHPDAELEQSMPKIPGLTEPEKKPKKKEKPSVSIAHVRGWVAAAANEIFSFSTNSYSAKKKENEEFFTKKGFGSFYAAVENGLLDSIKKKDQRIRGYIISPIAVMEPKKAGTIFVWDVAFSYVIEYISDEGTTYQFLRVAVVVRDQSDENGARVGIDRWKAELDPDPVFCPCRTDGGPKKDESLGDTLRRQFEIEEEAEEDPKKPVIPPGMPYYEYMSPDGGGNLPE